MDYFQDVRISLSAGHWTGPMYHSIGCSLCSRIDHLCGGDVRPGDLESALRPEHLESFLARTGETVWKDERIAQEWRKLQQILRLVRETRKKGQSLFHEALAKAKSAQESLECLSMIGFAVDCYVRMSASRAYPNNPALQNWAVNGYMLTRRSHILKDQEGGVSTGAGL